MSSKSDETVVVKKKPSTSASKAKSITVKSTPKLKVETQEDSLQEKTSYNTRVITKSPKAKPATENKNINTSYGTGKRKNAIARVWLKQGPGKIEVNNKLLDQYFSNESHKSRVLSPFNITNSFGLYDVVCTVKGGGSSGQADAVRHGISKALVIENAEFHKALRSNGFLTRDARVVERKKYGKHKARKSTQFSKR